MEALKLNIRNAVTTGFVDENTESFLEYRPSIVTNDPILNEKVLTTILDELRSCESFFLSVAFITSGGVASLFGELLELQAKNISGKILVSEYLNFTEPEALKRLKQLNNVELKIAKESDFHSKGFLFTHKSYYTIIIGSSNITQNALTKNKEWNLKVTAHKDSELFKQTLNEFNKVFESSHFVTEEYLEKYAFVYNSEKKLRLGLRKALLENETIKVEPNEMQKMALANLEHLRKQGKNKALLISATGTGKTYLSAFDVLKVKPKRILFLVHRRNIASKSMESFKNILGEKIKYGLYSGNQTDTSADYIFSTIQTFSREDHLKKFSANHFDYIIIDETHRASADSYQKILNHFKPTFLLGMTATPERTDSKDVFALFDYNIAYEIRLHDALAHDMLVPFHYYGISDIEINGELVDDKVSFLDLNKTERADHIISKLKLFGTNDGIVRGLIFCSRQEICEYLSEEFNKTGLKTLFLSSKSSEAERSRAIDLLETDDLEIKLDYIFTVDIFNEGIDIPRVNQIVMLRPTQSAIVFVQQLGRGLRKTEGKSYVTVIDFIGNYQNNFLVPIALFGDKTYVKDNLRKLVNRPEKSLIGASTIYFDRIVKEKIFHSINTGKLQEKRILVQEYNSLKGKIGRIPKMMDFVIHGERDPYQYVTNYESYYAFLLGQNEPIQKVHKYNLELLSFLSKEVLNPLRFIELHLLKSLLVKGEISFSQYSSNYYADTNYAIDDDTFLHAIHNINGLFVTEKVNKQLVKIGVNRKYSNVVFENENIRFGDSMKTLIADDDVKTYLIDLCNYSSQNLQNKSKVEFAKNDFILNQKYTRKDAFRILKWDENPVAQNVGGYMIEKNKKDCAIFVNYHKEEDISATTKYHDRFASRNEFIWMSKNKRNFKSPDVSAILQQSKYEMRIPLFVKKSNFEDKDFYYLGNINLIHNSEKEEKIRDENGKMVSIVEISFQLESPVEQSLYDYLLEFIPTNKEVKLSPIN
ncbi:MAG: DEAD/DEAH box helicase [Flavobacteriia bacterium]|jgi:superfamily II DNA or RNA helicase